MRYDVKMGKHVEFDKHANYEGHDHASALHKGVDCLLITLVESRP